MPVGFPVQVCAGASEAASSTSSWPSAACSEQYVGPATGPMPAEYSYGATAQEPDYPVSISLSCALNKATNRMVTRGKY